MCCVIQGSNAGDCVVYCRVVMLGTVCCVLQGSNAGDCLLCIAG